MVVFVQASLGPRPLVKIAKAVKIAMCQKLAILAIFTFLSQK